MCNQFFREEKRSEVVEAVASLRGWKKYWRRDMTVEEKEALNFLLQRFRVIDRVMSGGSYVKVCYPIVSIFQFHDFRCSTIGSSVSRPTPSSSRPGPGLRSPRLCTGCWATPGSLSSSTTIRVCSVRPSRGQRPHTR